MERISDLGCDLIYLSLMVLEDSELTSGMVIMGCTIII